MYSRLTSYQIGWFVEQLQNLEKWLDSNMTHFPGVRSPLGSHIPRRAGTPLQTSQLGKSNAKSYCLVPYLRSRIPDVYSLKRNRLNTIWWFLPAFCHQLASSLLALSSCGNQT